jgi:flagellum-specific peptidoglycan hydrolase FlgJ
MDNNEKRDTIRVAAAFDLSAFAKAEKIELQEEDLTLDQKRQAYIRKYGPVAVAEMKKFGIPASITIAQGLLETRAGTSGLAVKNNNHFGMKCFSRSCKKGHCSNFSDDTHKDFFLRFESSWASYRAHSKMLSSGRYKKLHNLGNDYRAWAHGLKTAGYATDPKYDDNLIRLIRLYSLDRLDRL